MKNIYVIALTLSFFLVSINTGALATSDLTPSYVAYGYSKEDFAKARRIAYHADKSVKEVLSVYEQTKSWGLTAKHFKVDWQTMKRERKEMKTWMKEHEDIVLTYLAEYANSRVEEFNQIDVKAERNPYHTLFKTAIIAKLSNISVSDVLKEKEKGESLQKIAEKHHITKKDLIQEMKIIREGLKEKMEEEQDSR